MPHQHIPNALFQVGTKIILKNQSNQILLLLRANQSSVRQTYWELPGGRVQEHETPEMAMLREVTEETGIIKINNLRLLSMEPSTFRIPITKEFCDAQESDITVGLIFAFYAGSVDSDKIILSSEHTEFQWINERETAEILINAYGPKIVTLLQ